MIFNKSLLKIYEVLLFNLDKSMIIEDLIKASRVGRSAGFNAVKELVSLGIVDEKTRGRQREISLRVDRYVLGFKIFLDSFRFKQFDGSLKCSAQLFVEYSKEISSVKSILLFGSCIVNKEYSDIDILCICDKDADRNRIINIRNKVEQIIGKTINLHFSANAERERFVNSLCIYGFDPYINLFAGNLAKQSYLEALDWFNSSIKNKTKSNFENILVNLAFAYCYSSGFSVKTKEEAKSLLFKQYPHVHKMNREEIRRVMNEIGKKIFR